MTKANTIENNIRFVYSLLTFNNDVSVIRKIVINNEIKTINKSDVIIKNFLFFLFKLIKLFKIKITKFTIFI